MMDSDGFKILKKLRAFYWDSLAKDLYVQLSSDKYSRNPYQKSDLGEGMAVVQELICSYWKPRYLLDHETQCAYEFMGADEYLITFSPGDVDTSTLTGVPFNIMTRVYAGNAHYPTIIHQYSNGRAEVRWTIHPDGRYFMDEDGYGMTDDDEIVLHGYIDRSGRPIGKFHR